MSNAPLVMIGFNRPEIQRKTLERVALADGAADRDIYVFIDGPRENRQDDVENTRKVREVFEEFRKAHFPRMTICKRERNLGCRGNIISSITEVVNRIGRVIVVEDDILVSRTFFKYHDAALEKYAYDHRIWCINAFVHDRMILPRSYGKDVFLTHRFMCFGWSTWKDRWNDVDFELKCWPEYSSNPENLKFMDFCSTWLLPAVKAQLENPDTWDVQCSFHLARRKMYSVNPRYSLTKNNGSGAGVHSLKFDYATAKHRYYNYMPELDADVMPDQEVLLASRYIVTGRPSAMPVWLGRLVFGKAYGEGGVFPSIAWNIRVRLARLLARTPLIPWNMEPIDIKP